MGFSYSIFCDKSETEKIRTSFVFSKPFLVESFLSLIDDFPEDAFFQNHKFPLDKTTVFSQEDPQYILPNTALEKAYSGIYRANGLKNSIIMTLRDDFLKKTEMFHFQSFFDDRSEWRAKQIRNLQLLRKFAAFFKGNALTLINNSLVSNEELFDFFPKDEKALSTFCESIDENQGDSNVNHYHLGPPFNKPLTKREFELLKLYFIGLSTKKMAINLNVSTRTIEKHLENIRSKTNCLRTKDLRQALFRCPSFLTLAGHLELN